ncbi:MAG: flagellar biosynthesis protein [candidate division Zixibacteria bacterium]|nr:flagellar biosynthesis protein [candidate division Zixibacteria bacterium]
MEIQNQIGKIPETIPDVIKNFNDTIPSGSSNFTDQLKRAASVVNIRFSGHALNRMNHRGISLSEIQMDKLNQAVENARSKGSRDSLVLLKDLAFVVNVKNNTVLTAMQTENLKDSVFTNIDSTVIG